MAQIGAIAHLVPQGLPPPDAGPKLNLVEQDDGGVILRADEPDAPKNFSDEHFANLAEDMSASELGVICEDLLDGIRADETSRADYISSIAKGIDLLGLKIEEPRMGDAAQSDAPVEGQSTVKSPLLLEATLNYHANAIAEFLPASGPVKVRTDETASQVPPEQPPAPPAMPMGQPGMAAPPGASAPPMGAQVPGLMARLAGAMRGNQPDATSMSAAPPAPMMPPQSGPAPPPSLAGQPDPMLDHNGGSSLAPPDQDALAEALEEGFNHYLLTTASEYYPDTTRMLFQLGLKGTGFKKVYNCPLRRRPVSESVSAEDLIVDNNATDLLNAERVTHKIMMRGATVKRMQKIGSYLDVSLSQPTQTSTAAEAATARVEGKSPTPSRPEDMNHTIYECYCWLDIESDPSDPPKPYRVTMDRDSRQVLELRRDWIMPDEPVDNQADDEEAEAKADEATYTRRETFVKFPFVDAFGFYSIGLMHILSNPTRAVTAAWRLLLDAGMFSNFPGFLYAKNQLPGQDTNIFRVAPGSGIGIDTGNQPIGNAVMPLPYKGPDAVFIQLIEMIGDAAKSAAGQTQLQIGEGRADVPVGTMIAMVEQATKVMAAVHKGTHNAFSCEFQLLKDRFREDPAAFWRHRKGKGYHWGDPSAFLAALENADIVPASDPNSPSHIHRLLKLFALKQLQQFSPQLYDGKAVDERILKGLEIDPNGLWAPPMPPQGAVPPDPAAMAKVQQQGQIAQQQLAQKAAEFQQTMGMKQQTAEAELQLKQHIADTEQASRRAELLLEHGREVHKNMQTGMGAVQYPRVI